MSRDPREVIREEPLMRSAILDALAGGPRTVTEIAEEIGVPANEAMFWVMGMRKYGLLAELPQPDGDRYRFAAVTR